MDQSRKTNGDFARERECIPIKPERQVATTSDKFGVEEIGDGISDGFPSRKVFPRFIGELTIRKFEVIHG